MSTNNIPKWNPEREAKLREIVGVGPSVSANTVATAAETLETSVNSVAAKLRKMEFDVESTAKSRQKTFSDDEALALTDFCIANAGQHTYAEIASLFMGGKFSAKQIQGKILSIELTDNVKATPKQEVVRTYTDEEEATFKSMAKAGAFLEDIAEKLDKSLNSVRGKALSLYKLEDMEIPKQRESTAKAKVDPLNGLGDVSAKTVEEIATAIDKTARGVKTMLTHRGIKCADWDGAKRNAKLNEKKDAA